jgi:shikimate kinase
MVVFFIGFMGSGKTFWAEKLSARLGLPWFDLDRLIEEKEGMEVRDIFREKGEAHFRAVEHDLLRSFCSSFANNGDVQAILACGGGTPCFQDNMDLMNRSGTTVWLNPPARILAVRLGRDSGQRPLLEGKKGADLEKFISFKLSERETHYGKARVVITDPVPNMAGIIKALAYE